ncbi:hypothetical protein SUGI_0174370 [Cryptomeria japonica]|nr:hypothetical protein SUGI_0174370 [Cryptomeria japonica]
MPFGIKGSLPLFTTPFSMFKGLFTAWKAWNQCVLDVGIIKNEFYHSVESSGDLVFSASAQYCQIIFNSINSISFKKIQGIKSLFSSVKIFLGSQLEFYLLYDPFNGGGV